jgi:hypothetical protein
MASQGRPLPWGLGYTLYGLYDLTAGQDSILAWGDAIFVGPRIRQSLGRAKNSPVARQPDGALR